MGLIIQDDSRDIRLKLDLKLPIIIYGAEKVILSDVIRGTVSQVMVNQRKEITIEIKRLKSMK